MRDKRAAQLPANCKAVLNGSQLQALSAAKLAPSNLLKAPMSVAERSMMAGSFSTAIVRVKALPIRRLALHLSAQVRMMWTI